MHVTAVSDIGAFLGLDVGKGEHQATTVGGEEGLRCLARRRADVLFSMLRDGAFCKPRPAAA
jgi:hypothetical protein